MVLNLNNVYSNLITEKNTDVTRILNKKKGSVKTRLKALGKRLDDAKLRAIGKRLDKVILKNKKSKIKKRRKK